MSDLHVQAVGPSWANTLKLLDIPCSGNVLPLRTTCPLCHRRELYLYDDNRDSGGWHHCRGCNSSGDLAELAAAVWRVSLQQARQQLALGPDLSDYVRQQQAMAFWEAARQRFAHDLQAPLPRLRQQFGLNLEASSERWAAGPAQLVGSAPFKEAATACGKSNAFRRTDGRKWAQVLAVPFYDLPGRLCGFSFSGREGQTGADQVHIALKGSSDGGLAWLPLIVRHNQARHVIAVEDWLLALRLHFRYLHQSLLPMPLVAWRDDGACRTRQAWAALGGRTLIFWASQLEERVLLQAVENDGLICLHGTQRMDSEAISHDLRLRPAMDLERTIVQKARPWAEALRLWLATGTEGDAAQLINRLEEAGADVSYILRSVGNGRSDLRTPATKRGIPWGKDRVIEQGDRWCLVGRKQQVELANATFRILHAIKDRQSGQVYYSGTIRHAGREIPYVAREEDVRDHTVQWLAAKLLEFELGVFACHARHAGSLHQLAVLFHTPQVVSDDLWRWTERLKTTEQAAREQPTNREPAATPSPARPGQTVELPPGAPQGWFEEKETT